MYDGPFSILIYLPHATDLGTSFSRVSLVYADGVHPQQTLLFPPTTSMEGSPEVGGHHEVGSWSVVESAEVRGVSPYV